MSRVMILEFVWKCEGSETAKNNLDKAEKRRRIYEPWLPNFFSKTTVGKMVWFWHRDRHRLNK